MRSAVGSSGRAFGDCSGAELLAGRRKKAAAKGRIARYAWGDDYHELIEQKLTIIDEFLRERGGSQKCYVDTGPVLERDYAAEAGIGWHGKSTMLIDREARDLVLSRRKF